MKTKTEYQPKANEKGKDWNPSTTGGATRIDDTKMVPGNDHPQQEGSSSK